MKFTSFSFLHRLIYLDIYDNILKEKKMKCTGNMDVNVWPLHESNKKMILRMKGGKYEVTSILDSDFL